MRFCVNPFLAKLARETNYVQILYTSMTHVQMLCVELAAAKKTSSSGPDAVEPRLTAERSLT
jgi:hypothetical protein